MPKYLSGTGARRICLNLLTRHVNGDPKANSHCFYLSVGLKMGLNHVCPAVVTQYQHVVNSDLFNQSLTLFLSKISNWEKNQHRCPGKMNNKYNEKCPFLQVGGFLDVLGAPRRRSWRPEEERRVDGLEEENSGKEVQSQQETNGRLYVNLPERSASYDYGRGGSSQSKKMEVRVGSCPEMTTPL